MKNFVSSRARSCLKKKNVFKALWLSVLLMTILPFSNGQPQPLNDKTRAAIETISKYADSGYERLSHQFEQIGYTPPEHLKADWQKWPTIRRVEMAYREYEYLVQGEGDKFLALMSQSLAQQYDPVRSESALKPYLIQDENLPKRLVCNRNLINLQGYEQVIQIPEISLEAELAVVAISRYTESGALGGNQYLLAEYCKQTDVEIYEIFVNFKNSEALIEGVRRASSKLSTDEIIRKMTEHVCHYYEGAREEPSLKNWKTGATKFSSENSVKKKIQPIEGPGGGHNIEVPYFTYSMTNTLRMVELVPDIYSNSIQIIINPTFKNKISPNFYQEFGWKLQKMFNDAPATSLKHGPAFEKMAFDIENEMREFLKNSPDQEFRTPANVRKLKPENH